MTECFQLVRPRVGRRDRLVMSGWRSIVLLMIFLLAVAGIGLAYRGVFGLIAGAWPSSLANAMLAVLAGVFVKWLCDHRNDLVEG